MTQGPPPNKPDPNRLGTFKPHNVARKEFDADRHGFADLDAAEQAGSELAPKPGRRTGAKH